MWAAYFASFHLKGARPFLSQDPLYTSSEKTVAIPSGKPLPLSSTLFGYSTLSMMLDYDDYLMAGHTGHSAVFLPFAAALPYRLSGRELLRLIVLGNEAEARLGTSILIGPLNGQMWSFLHSFGGAAILGLLDQLSPQKLAELLSLSLGFPHALLPRSFFASDLKFLAASYPLLYGMQCRKWQKEGLRSALTLEGKDGFLAQYAALSLEKVFASSQLFTETLSYKPYPGCAYIDSAVDALLLIRKEAPRRFPDQILVEGSLPTAWMEEWGSVFLGEGFPQTLNFTLPVNLVLAWKHGELRGRHFASIKKNTFQLAKRVTVRHNPSLTKAMLKTSSSLLPFRGHLMRPALFLDFLHRAPKSSLKEALLALPASLRLSKKPSFPRPKETGTLSLPFPCRVHALFGGKKYSQEVLYPRGSSGTPLKEQEETVQQKFFSELSFFYPERSVEALWQSLQRLETLDCTSFRELVDLMCGTFTKR